MKAWWRRKMGSLAEPCTDDMEPFIKTCRALCMVLWPRTDMPVSGSAKPAVRKEDLGISVYINVDWLKQISKCTCTLYCVPKAPVCKTIHRFGFIFREVYDKFHIGRCRQTAHAVRVMIARVTQKRALPGGVAQCLSVVVVLRLGADHLQIQTHIEMTNIELLLWQRSFQGHLISHTYAQGPVGFRKNPYFSQITLTLKVETSDNNEWLIKVCDESFFEGFLFNDI